MRWQSSDKKERLRNWHLHFALLPVLTRTGVWVWFEYVWRKGELKPTGHYGAPEWEFEYMLAQHANDSERSEEEDKGC